MGESGEDQDFVTDPDPQVVHMQTTLHIEGPWVVERKWLCVSVKRVASVFASRESER